LLVRWHHEWWNGTGYPDALRREEIPLGARILRLADSYAALTETRPFRRKLTVENAREELIARAGIEFDPGVVRVFLSLEPVPESDLFAKPEEPQSMVEPSDRSRDLFSSFSK
jgi:HD-GYP domain-containing protein (c-di-GMP phosphodiesterase class II)